MNTQTDGVAQFYANWYGGPGLAKAIDFTYEPGEDRATGYLDPLAEWLAPVINRLEQEFGVRFTVVAFQAYRNGAGCDWHSDTPFDVQAVLSTGTTRRFGIRRIGGDDPVWFSVRHGDLVYMPSGHQSEFEHCVPVEDELGQRISVVFRTPKG